MKTFINAPFVYEYQGNAVEVVRNQIVDMDEYKIYGPVFKSGIHSLVPKNLIDTRGWQQVA